MVTEIEEEEGGGIGGRPGAMESVAGRRRPQEEGEEEEEGGKGERERRQEELKEDVFTAAAYGQFEKLKRLVEKEGKSVSEPDELGYYPLQWAGLNNRTVVAQYLIEQGADVNASDLGGQTALHWCAVRGSVQTADLLLKEGARLNASDQFGYQPTHVAAQYGKTVFLYHIATKWNADSDVPDNQGRSPMHWAAYKGYGDTVRLLLFVDAYRGRQDTEGCTPLHWAAIKGHLEVCTVLIQAGKKEDLMVVDNTGFTPAQLASNKNHHHVAFFLGNARRVFDKKWDMNTPLGRLSKIGLAPALWCMIIILLATYVNSVISAPQLVKLTASFGLFAWLGVLLATSGLVMLYRCGRKDPGYIKMNMGNSQNDGDEEPLLKMELNEHILLAGNWSQLCSTCKIVRPLRSKHCSTCDRCVEQFDHHCPWVSNCIGKKNKWDFFIFLILECSAIVVTGAATIIRITMDPLSPSSFGMWIKYSATQHPGAVAFFMMDFFLFFGVAMLTIVQVSQISRNITTNETANLMRYTYLRDPSGRFRNPYDHGIFTNCSDFCIKGYNEDTRRIDSMVDSNGIGAVQMSAMSHSHNGEILSHPSHNGTNGSVLIDVHEPHTTIPHGRSQSNHCSCSRNHNSNNGHHKPDNKTDGAPLGLGFSLTRLKPSGS